MNLAAAACGKRYGMKTKFGDCPHFHLRAEPRALQPRKWCSWSTELCVHGRTSRLHERTAGSIPASRHSSDRGR